MAQLKDTTINGGLTVKSGGAGVELFGSTPYIDFHYNNNSGDYTSRIIESASGVLNVQATDLKLNGDSLGKPNTLFHESQNQAVVRVIYDTNSDGTVKYWYVRPDTDIAATSRLGTSGTRWNYIYCDYLNASATVAANNFTVPNGYAYYAKNSTGTNKAIAYLSTSNNMMFGHPDASSSHAGYTQISAPNGALYLKSKGGILSYSASTLTGVDSVLRPNGTSNVVNLGSADYSWNKIYAKTTAVQSSDRRLKSDIKPIAEYSNNALEDLFDDLKPTVYHLNHCKEDGYHIGFVAQDVAESMKKLNFEESDLALIEHNYWTDEETGEEKEMYSLGYAEFTALNTYIIQKQKEKINLLEERIAALEKLAGTK